MKKISVYIMLLTTALIGCSEDNGDFDNKIYFEGTPKVKEFLVERGVEALEGTLQVGIPKPENSDIAVSYQINPLLVNDYKLAYYEEAQSLPEGSYNLEETSSVINAGEVISRPVKISFINLSGLDSEEVYVLPVSIASTNLAILESDQTIYYVFRGADLINVVADIEENFLTINWTNPEVVNNLSQVTLEALIRARDFDRLISTVMGIEGKFLIRIGDAGYPSDQIQVATSLGNFPGSDSNLGLPLNEWIHIALTYDATEDGKMILYVNGRPQAESFKDMGALNLSVKSPHVFQIGRSYADDRYLAGNISECRIWNVVRTPEQIRNNPYFVPVDSEGLVAYWKFNDESEFSVKDHTGNNNNAVSNSPLMWTPVKLPEPESK